MISDSSLEYLATGCFHLQCLHLDECRITDGGLALIAQHCTMIKELNLRDCGRVTDESIKALSLLGSLEILNLKQCNRVTDVALYCIGLGFHSLTYLNIRGYRVTPAAVSYLQTERPDLVVEANCGPC